MTKEPKADQIHAPVEAAKKTYSKQEFIAEYDVLCKRTGWIIAGQPALRQLNDLGGCLITVQMGIIPYREGQD